MSTIPPNTPLPESFPLAGTYGELLTVLTEAAAVRYTTVACAALLLYDHLLTLYMELEIIWTLPWGLPKISFTVNHYITTPMIIFNAIVLTLQNQKKFCGFWIKSQAVPTFVAIVTVELMVIIRITAMYGNSKLVFRTLILLWICEAAAMLVIVGLLYHNPIYPVPPIPFLPGCYPSTFVPWIYGIWVSPVVFESILMVFMVYKVFNLYCRANESQTIKILSRDSLIYFSAMFSILISNLFIFKYAPAFISSLLVGPSSALACVAAARMMMNLRDIQRNGIETEWKATSLEFRPVQRSTDEQEFPDSFESGSATRTRFTA